MEDTPISDREKFLNLIESIEKDGDPYRVNELLNAGSPLTDPHSKHHSAIQYAAFLGNNNIIKSLFDHGAEPEDIHIGTPNQESMAHLAVRKGNHTFLKMLIEKDPSLVNRVGAHKSTPLHIAAKAKDPKSVKILLENGANPNARGARNETAIMEAAHSSYSEVEEAEEIIDLLIAHGASINAKNIYGETALMSTISELNIKIAEKLLRYGINPDIPNRHGSTALAEIMIIGAKDFSESLGMDSQESMEHTREVTDFIQMLIRNGAHGIPLWKDSPNPLHSNKIQTKPWLMQKLVDIAKRQITSEESFKEAINKQDEDGRTPIHMAILQNNHEAVELLISLGADGDICDYSGISPLENVEEERMRNILSVFDIDNPKRARKRSSVWGAIINEDVPTLNMLLKDGKDPDKENVEGLTPLSYAVENGLTEAVKVLVNNGADINANAPLSLAIRRKDFETVDLLLSAGADPNKKNKYGKTAIEEAKERKLDFMADMMKKQG